MPTIDQILQATANRLSTSRAHLLAAFDRVIELNGRRKLTDLHVRRLLKYVRAQDRYYTGVQKSLQQLANKLELSVATCRRVIRRAAKEFGLLIVIPQLRYFGGQTFNRYTINWDQVHALLRLSEEALTLVPEDDELSFCRPEPAQRSSGNSSSVANTSCQSGSDIRPSCSDPSDSFSQSNGTLEPLRSSASSAVKSSSSYHSPVVLRPRAARTQSGSDIRSSCYDPYLKKSPLPIAQPRGTPPEMLAHFEPILAKIQTAIDIAKQLGATRIHDHLVRLRSKIKAVRTRASHPALCRTYLPPIIPPPEPTWEVIPIDLSKITVTPIDFSKITITPIDFSKITITPIDWSTMTPTPIDPSELSSRAAALYEQAQELFSRFSASGATTDASGATTDASGATTPNDRTCDDSSQNQTPKAENLHDALDDLLVSINAALQCARKQGITWLQSRFKPWRRTLKTIRLRANTYACASNLQLPESRVGRRKRMSSLATRTIPRG